MARQHLTKDDVTAIKRQLITAGSSIEDAASWAACDERLQERLRAIWCLIRNELENVQEIAPRIERPGAGRAQ